MSRLVDLTGQRFGMLTVLHRSEKPHSCVYWMCRCDCGAIVEVSGNNLKRGHHVSCGCRRVKPYVGKKYGMLTVLEKNNRNRPVWKHHIPAVEMSVRLRKYHISPFGLSHLWEYSKLRDLLMEHRFPEL